MCDFQKQPKTIRKFDITYFIEPILTSGNSNFARNSFTKAGASFCQFKLKLRSLHLIFIDPKKEKN